MEECLPLRGRWLRYGAIGLLVCFWLLWGYLDSHPVQTRVYHASSPDRPYVWHEVPRRGLDCQHRMMFTDNGETARSLRMGDLVIEIYQEENITSGRSILDGPDCR